MPVIKIDILRAVLNNYYIVHCDVNNTFLNSDIHYELYLRIKGLEGLYRALKEIYGLETSDKSWYDTLANKL